MSKSKCEENSPTSHCQSNDNLIEAVKMVVDFEGSESWESKEEDNDQDVYSD